LFNLCLHLLSHTPQQTPKSLKFHKGWGSKFATYAGGGCGFPTELSSKRPRRLCLRPGGRALKGAISAASGTGGLRNRLCRLSQAGKRTVCRRKDSCRNGGLFFAVIENTAEHTCSPPRRVSREPAEDGCPAARGESC
jgi:hypothetical protein